MVTVRADATRANQVARAIRARVDAALVALVALGRLDAVTDRLPNASIVLYGFVRKEVVLSSMIEGTQSSLADLLLYEVDEQPGVPIEDAREVSRHVAALTHGLKRLRGGFPLSLRLIRERFLHDAPDVTPPLAKAALAHVQFETIHPFLDGNGRVGRLLIALQLVADDLLRQPLLYLSLHFKEQRAAYYELLNRVRQSGDWEAWLEFFAEAIERSAAQAAGSARRLLDPASADAVRIERLGRASASALAIHRALQRRPIATAASLAAATKLTPATVNTALAHLERLRIVVELTSRQRVRVFSYAKYTGILNEGMAPPKG